ncbi:diphthine--ammonia ligase [Chloroflexota bacterium]
MSRVFASWSGGKDCCLACYRAKVGGLDVRYLANTVTEDGQRSCSHGLSAGVIQVQSRAMGIPVVQRNTTRETYEDVFTEMLKGFKQAEIEGGVFGDIDFNAHREWIERVCRNAGITPHLPLWEESQDKLMAEFIDSGFEAVVVAAKADLFDEDILGQKIDHDFLKHLDKLRETKDITPCGEAGEYHTLVIDGPLFQQRIEILDTKRELREGRWFLDILKTALRAR